MLLRFKVENFLSFNKNTEISLISGKARKFPEHIIQTKNISAVKSAVIYGANASGKSNLVKSIDFAARVIQDGLNNLNTMNKTFRLAKENKNISTFEFEFCIGDKYYAYGFSSFLREKVIYEEWLYELKKDSEICLFERNKSDIKTDIKFSNAENKNRFEIYSEDIRSQKSKLFLTDLSDKNLKNNKDFEIFQKIFNWFKTKIVVIYPDTIYAGINFINTDSDLKNIYSNMLKYFDTGIDDIISVEISMDELLKKHPNLRIPEIESDLTDNKMITLNLDSNLYTVYKKRTNEIRAIQLGILHEVSDDKSETFEFCDESDGTRRLFDLIPLLYSFDNKDRIFIIDEIDRSLHPNLTYNFLKLFLSQTNNKSQLLLITHDSNLLDQKLLRRDEIWFVEKDHNKSSQLTSLDNFQERFDKEIKKAYLVGRYGAVPNFKSSYIKKLGLDKWEE